jgi:DNA-binding response OmpR family regulator
MKKILIIEDEPDVARSIKMYLEKAGYTAAYTLDPMEGLEKLKDFDLLLLDLIMPKISGRAVLREMKSRGIKTPIIVLSAISLPATVGEELAREFPGLIFVPKTSLHAQLLPAIKKTLGE